MRARSRPWFVPVQTMSYGPQPYPAAHVAMTEERHRKEGMKRHEMNYMFYYAVVSGKEERWHTLAHEEWGKVEILEGMVQNELGTIDICEDEGMSSSSSLPF